MNEKCLKANVAMSHPAADLLGQVRCTVRVAPHTAKGLTYAGITGAKFEFGTIIQCLEWPNAIDVLQTFSWRAAFVAIVGNLEFTHPLASHGFATPSEVKWERGKIGAWLAVVTGGVWSFRRQVWHGMLRPPRAARPSWLSPSCASAPPIHIRAKLKCGEGAMSSVATAVSDPSVGVLGG